MDRWTSLTNAYGCDEKEPRVALESVPNRRKNDSHESELTDANLTDANLTDANLTDANMREAQASHANLIRAKLQRNQGISATKSAYAMRNLAMNWFLS